jgi:hypothetical protein
VAFFQKNPIRSPMVFADQANCGGDWENLGLSFFDRKVEKSKNDVEPVGRRGIMEREECRRPKARAWRPLQVSNSIAEFPASLRGAESTIGFQNPGFGLEAGIRNLTSGMRENTAGGPPKNGTKTVKTCQKRIRNGPKLVRTRLNSFERGRRAVRNVFFYNKLLVFDAVFGLIRLKV